MRLLLDTHAFLWWVDDNRRLSRKARAAIASRQHTCYLSLASVWEMAIKASLERLSLPSGWIGSCRSSWRRNGFEALPIDLRHSGEVAQAALPPSRPVRPPAGRPGAQRGTDDRVGGSRLRPSMVSSECGEGHSPLPAPDPRVRVAVEEVHDQPDRQPDAEPLPCLSSAGPPSRTRTPACPGCRPARRTAP